MQHLNQFVAYPETLRRGPFLFPARVVTPFAERWQTPELVEDYDDDLWGFGNSDDDEWFGV